MRIASLLAAILLSACGSSSSGGGDGEVDAGGDPQADAGDEGPPDSFRLVTADVEIAAGDERTHCYYATLPIDRDVGVKRWSSVMTPGSHHMIVYALASSDEPDGTIDEDCSVLGSIGGGLPTWSYSAQTPEADFPMPDGVGITMAADQKVVVEMHYLNASPDPITAHVELVGEYYAEGVDFTPASAFITYDTSINIPAQSVGQAGGSCSVPDDARFFALSTHAHKRATLTRVSDDSGMVFESDDWEDPGLRAWTDPFYEFAGDLTYRCEYFNGSNQPVNQGPSAATDEMCMAVGYFFPATQPRFCIN